MTGAFLWAGALAAAFLLDCLLGDPRWLYHPVRLIGRLISAGERGLRRIFSATPGGELVGGVLLAALVPAVSAGAVLGLLILAAWIHPALWLLLEIVFSYQILAVKSLRVESMAVCRRLKARDLPGARKLLSRIVGRDTGGLDEAGVVRAAVETVAENTTDGVAAPLCYMTVGGAALGFFYKAVNTLDSMVGYNNERYRYFGRASARLDDALGYLPARLAALLTVAAAGLCGWDARRAWRVWRRDGRKHQSPNSAQTEAACAGALGIALAGPASYGGVWKDKPVIGDETRPVDVEDIPRACQLMTACGGLTLGLGLIFRVAVAAALFWQFPFG